MGKRSTLYIATERGIYGLPLLNSLSLVAPDTQTGVPRGRLAPLGLQEKVVWEGVGGRGTLLQRKKVESDQKKKKPPNTTLYACVHIHVHTHYKGVGELTVYLEHNQERRKSLKGIQTHGIQFLFSEQAAQPLSKQKSQLPHGKATQIPILCKSHYVSHTKALGSLRLDQQQSLLRGGGSGVRQHFS